MKKLLLATTAVYLLLVGHAFADPITTGIGALLSTSIAGTGLTVGSVALGIASMGAQWLISKLLTPTPEVKQRGVKTRMETGGDTSPGFILGEYATAGALAYVNVWDGGSIPQQYLTYVIILSAMPVDGISNFVYVNGERCTAQWGTQDEDGFSYVDEYEKYGNHYLKLKFYDGTQTTADPWLRDKFGDDPDRPWLSDMRLSGCAYIIAVCSYSNKGVWTGNPEFRWVVRGAKLYDPTKDSSVGGSGSQRWEDAATWAFTRNAKVIEYNVIRGIKYDGSGGRIWGGDAEAYRLPLEYWFAAINVCNENITKQNGDVINRYEIGCEVHFEDKPIDIIGEINKACSGYTTEAGGVYKTWCGSPGLSVATITDGDFVITAEMETNRFQPRQNTYNTAYGTYPEPREQWEVKDSPRYQDEDALAEDGEELALDVPLPFVSENNQVQRVLRAAIKDSRRQVQHAGQLPPGAYVLEPNDRITFESDYFGYGGSGKDFILAAKDDLPNVNQQVTLREVNPNDTTWLTAYELDHRVGALTVVKPGTLDLDFTVSADQIDTDEGKDKPAILVEWAWAAVSIDVDYIRWELRRQGTTKIIKEGAIYNIEEGSRSIRHDLLRFGKTYQIRLKAKPLSKRDSSWTDWISITMVGVDTPNAPTLEKIKKLDVDGSYDFFARVNWDEVDQKATYVVRVVTDTETHYYPADEPPYRIPLVTGLTHVVAIRAIGADGTKGNWSDTNSITVTDRNNPSVRTKSKRRSKTYTGSGTTHDTGFIEIDIENRNGQAVHISWEWLVAGRYKVDNVSDASAVSVTAKIWKKRAGGAKVSLGTVVAHGKHKAGRRRNLQDDFRDHSNKVFIDPKPKKDTTTTYGVDLTYRGLGAGTHRANVRRCVLSVAYSKR